MAEMRALSVRQPWAWAIACGGKTVENRTWHTRHRGLLAIHASKTLPYAQDLKNPLILNAIADQDFEINEASSRLGAVVAIAELTGCHHAEACAGNAATDELGGRGHLWCSPWAMPGQFHIVIASVRPLPDPVPCRGMLGLWRLPGDVEEAVLAQLSEVPDVQ